MKLRVCSVIGAVEVRPSVGAVSGAAHTRLGTGSGPPTGGVLGQLAHLHATSGSARLVAAAIATAGGHAAERRRGIGEQTGGGNDGKETAAESATKESGKARTRATGPGHDESFCRLLEKNP